MYYPLCYLHFYIVFKRPRLRGFDIVWNPQSSNWKWELCPPKTCRWGAPWPQDCSVLPSEAGSTSCKEPHDWAHDFFHKWPIPATLVLHLRGRRPGGAHQQTRTGHQTVGKGNAWGKAKTALRHINPRPWERRASYSLPGPWRGRPAH